MSKPRNISLLVEITVDRSWSNVRIISDDFTMAEAGKTERLGDHIKRIMARAAEELASNVTGNPSSQL